MRTENSLNAGKFLSVPADSETTVRSGRMLASPLLAGFLWLVAVLVSIPNVASLPARSTRWDFSHYYLSALVLRRGANPYHTDLAQLGRDLGLETGSINRAGYPPTFVLCFEPLTLLPPITAYWVWIVISVLMLAGAFWLLAEEAELPRRLVPSAVALAFLYSPLWNHFKFAQCQILVLLLVVVMMRAMRTGRDWLAGSALAAAILLRIFPATLVGYLLVRREWRALAYTAIVSAVGGALTLLVTGFRTGLSFFDVIGFVTAPVWLSSETNVALTAAISRLFGFIFGNNPGPIVEVSRSLFDAAAVVAVLAMAVAGSWTPQGRQPDRDWRAVSLWVVVTILVAPTAWMHYLVLLYIPLAMVLGSAERGSAGRAESLMALGSYLGASYIVVGFLAALAQAAPRRHATVLIVEREAFFCYVLLLYLAMYKFATAAANSFENSSPLGATLSQQARLDEHPPRLRAGAGP